MPSKKRPPPSRSPSPTRRPPPPSPPRPPASRDATLSPPPRSTADPSDKASETAKDTPKEEGELSPGPAPGQGYTLEDMTYPPFDVLLHPIGARTETVNLIFRRVTPFFRWEDAVPDLLGCIQEQRELRPHAAPFGGSIYCQGLIRYFLEVLPPVPGTESPYLMQFHHWGHTVFDTESTDATVAWMSTIPLNPSFEEEWALEILAFLLACALITVRRGWVRDYRERKMK
ncbi:hypothetical protein BO86DRAFT_397139 [Aspergillus japonicus CBS 114.51]|uniref:Uncharacterized protein n=1 Tax=Aspergillus japonicus CBS 114.51 TaxID=1448312 RepID=A0A8T8X9S8_ASPJA|nr:hypothetical protein BO86DRAFT_397139 [Aspergillus japonicus CBS 114.51]RAH84272.1 hypothetical protein BO86DRAFT_397139 [Aspergillus japonicus CBS 114.51]